MRASIVILYLLPALALGVFAADQEKVGDRGFSLRGKVVDGVTGQPIRDVQLRLSDLNWEPVAEPTAPDSQGRFVFSGLTAGEYILSGDGPESGPVFFDELPEPHIVQTIRIKPEESEKFVVFRIFPRAAIGGTVRDEFGDPVQRAEVTFYRPAWFDGRVILQHVQHVTTDDRGRYRGSRLASGGYVIAPVSITTAKVRLWLQPPEPWIFHRDSYLAHTRKPAIPMPVVPSHQCWRSRPGGRRKSI